MTGEFDLIEQLFRPMAGDAGLGLRDDAALFRPPPNMDIVLTTDALVADVHFPANAPPDMIAARLVACNAADLAAKGAAPAGCLLTLGVGPDWDTDFLTGFAKALAARLARFNLPLWGGDTVRSATGFVSLAAHGLVPTGEMVRRANAQPGDDVYVTGTIGDGLIGLLAVTGNLPPALSAFDQQLLAAAYADPQPPVGLAPLLRQFAHAAIDVSDGLMADLDHICQASNVAMTVSAEAIGLSEAGRAFAESQENGLAQLVSAGDDGQLAFTAPPQARDGLAQMTRQADITPRRIGQVTALPSGAAGDDKNAARAILQGAEGAEIVMSERGFRHF